MKRKALVDGSYNMTARLLPLTILYLLTSSCGARSGLDDFGAAAQCPEGSYNVSQSEALECAPWSDCSPGEYIIFGGTADINRQCAPCPDTAYTTKANEWSCSYGACQFDEVILAPRTPTSPAICGKDPDGTFISPGQADVHLGASAGATLAYLGLATRGYPAAQILGFDGGTLISQRSVPLDSTAHASSFALGPDESIFVVSNDDAYAQARLTKLDSSNVEQWSYAQAFEDLTTHSFGTPFALVATTDSHVLTWGALQSSSDGTLLLPMAAMTLDGGTPELVRSPSPTLELVDVAVDSGEGIWIAGQSAGDSQVFRYDSATASPEHALSLPDHRVAIAAAPTGEAYAAWAIGTQLFLAQYDTDALMIRYEQLALELPGNPEIVSVQALGRSSNGDLVVAGVFGEFLGPGSTGMDVFVAKIFASTGGVGIKSFRGRWDEGVTDVVVTQSGDFYATGTTQLQNALGDVDLYIYLRRVF